MKKIYLLPLLLALPARADSLVCDHNIMGAPFATVELELLPEGGLGARAKITMYGRSHLESVSQEEPGESEMFHLWLSKENPNNSIEMIVYKQDKGGVRSLLINERLPFGKEIPGTCSRVGLN